MKCPVCSDAALVMSERQGVEIDYCPKCRGVWLDRGELDKIIEKATQDTGRVQAAEPPQHPQANPHRYDHNQGYGSSKPYRKKSFLEELFD